MLDFRFIASIILSSFVLVTIAAGSNNISVSGSFNNSSSTGAQVQNLEPQSKTHEYTLVAEETTLEIAPDVRVDAWTYNGTIPGPTLTATEGDRVIVHFINKTPLPHTVHFHGDHPIHKMVCLSRLWQMEPTLMISLQLPLGH